MTTQMQERVSTKSVALVAGDGKLPALLARSAKERGYRLVALALSKNAEAQVSPHADAVYLIAPGQLGRNLQILRKENIKEVVFIGKVPKLEIFRNLTKFDWIAIKEVSKLPNLNDDTIQSAMGNLVEAHGMKVLLQRDFLQHLFQEYGVMTKTQPNAGQYADIEFGIRVAKEIARLDIGQTVIVRNQMIMAVEAIEGTDQAIRRAVALAKGPVVVCKVSKPGQDQRFDVPAVGMNTLNSMLSEKPGGVLAVEAGETMVVEREEMVKFADEHGIAMVAV